MTHIFDVDHTIIRKTSTQYFLQIAMKEKLIRFSQVKRLPLDWLKYKLAFPDINFIENTVKSLSGIKKYDLDRIADVCFNIKIKPNIYLGAAQIINTLMNKGDKVIFATSSFDFIINPLERFFGIKDSLACRMEYEDGVTTGNLVGYSFFGPKKKTAACDWMEKNNIKKEETFFYSDSYTDLPLLEHCGYPVAVNPDSILARQARKKGWEIIRFKDVMGNTTS